MRNVNDWAADGRSPVCVASSANTNKWMLFPFSLTENLPRSILYCCLCPGAQMKLFTTNLEYRIFCLICFFLFWNVKSSEHSRCQKFSSRRKHGFYLHLSHPRHIQKI
jgi:hypothetical protein